MASLKELFNQEKKTSNSSNLSTLFNNKKEEEEEEEKKSSSWKNLFQEKKTEKEPLKELFNKKNVLEGSVIDGGDAYKRVDKDDKDGYWSWDYVKEHILKRTYFGAGRDVTQGTIDFTNYLSKKLPSVDENIISTKLKKIEEPEYFGGKISRDLLGFLGVFKGIDKVSQLTKIPQTTNKLINSIKILTKGGIAEQFAFSPYEKRLSNLLEEHPKFSNSVTAYLKAVDTDDEDTARQKMFIEGSILSIPFEAISWLTRATDNIKIKAGKTIDVNQKIKKNISIFSKKDQESILKSSNKLEAFQKAADKKFKDRKFKKDSQIGKEFKKLEEDLTRVETAFPPPRTAEGVDIPLDLSSKILSKVSRNKTEKAILELFQIGKVTRNPYLKITEQMGDLIATNRVSDEAFLSMLKKHKVSNKEFAEYFVGTVGDAGRILNAQMKINAKIKALSKVPGAADEFAAAVRASGGDVWDNPGFWRRLSNIRRTALVGQLATHVRNFDSQVARGGLGVMQQGMDFGMQRAVKSIFPNLDIKMARPIEAAKAWTNIFRQFKPSIWRKVKKDTDQILSYFPKEQDKLFLNFSSDVISKVRGKGGLIGTPLKGLEGAMQLFNITNKLQEFVVRRAAFQGSLDSAIANSPKYYKGKNLSQLINENNTKIIRRQDIEQAVDDALEITFARAFEKGEGYNSVARGFIKFINKVPFTLDLALPFPRFMMNSLKFHIDFSPLGIFNFMSKAERAALMKGDTSKISRAVLGTAMLTAAYYIRKQPYAGEKWYELRWGDKTIDVRPFNPFAAYLWVADFMIRVQEDRLRDFDIKGLASVFFGTRGGTSLWLVDRIADAWTGADPRKDKVTEAKRLIGKIVGAFAQPLQTFTDFASQMFPEMAVVKDVRSEPIIGEFKKRIPLNFDLPALYSATSIEYNGFGVPVARTLKKESPAWRQVTGMSLVTEKNAAEKEFDRLGFLHREIFQSTGIPELDHAYKNIFAPKIAIGISTMVESPAYQALPEHIKGAVLKGLLKKAKKETTKSLQKNSDIAPYVLKYKIETMTRDQRKVIDEMLGKDFLKELIKFYIN